MDDFTARISEVNDDIDTEFNWIIGSAAIFLFSAWIYSSAIHSVNGGRYFVFLPFFSLYWLIRAILRIQRKNRGLIAISIELGENLLRPVNKTKKIIARISWPISLLLSYVIVYAM